MKNLKIGRWLTQLMKPKSLLFLFLLPFSWIWGEIEKTTHWEPIREAIEHAPANTWVIFDVDDVLLIPEDAIFHPAHQDTFVMHADRLHEKMEHEELMHLWGILFSTRKAKLVDIEVLQVLELIQNRLMRAFALTHCGTGKVGGIEKLEDWRIAELNSLGICFDALSQCDIESEFDQYRGKYGVAILKSGVIFAADFDKGAILMHAFDVIGEMPKQLIFIDDKRHNLTAVESACLARGIAFQGFEYVAVAENDPFPINLEKVDIQFRVLENEKKWLSDQELEEYP
ncbi:DUF2608 domain-containing protein [Simkania negevensis]|nr:DUF2608 domain-containing protein [Simkania negevensis]